METALRPFHLAIPVNNLETGRYFYGEILECEEGRSNSHWIDFNFFGHQLVLHLNQNSTTDKTHNPVDGKSIPVPHFGVVLAWDDFFKFAESLKEKKVSFIIEPYIRFEGLPGEQATLFFKDPSGNSLEFKAFKHIGNLFKK